MKYTILICLILLAGINFFCLTTASFVAELHLEQMVLAVNGLSAIILIVVFYRQQLKYEQQQTIPLAQQTEELDSLDNSDESLLEYMLNFLCLKDTEGRWLKASYSYLESFNLQDVDYRGKTDAELAQYPQSDARSLRLAAIQDKSAWHLRKQVKETRTVVYPDKRERILEITRIPVFDAKKNKSKLILTGHFITVEASDAAKQENAVLDMSEACHICHFSLIFLDAGFKVIKANNAFYNATGYVLEELEGKPLASIIEGEFDPVKDGLIDDKDKSFWSGELVCQHKQGYFFPIQLNVTALNKDYQQARYFASLFDITRQKQTEKRIMQIAHYDDLTGLVNRVRFFEHLNQLLSERKQKQYGVVFLIDLDRFKAVNDSLGHDAGDELLKEVARRLLSVVRKQDVVARLSGDEFALLLLGEPSHEQAVYSASMVAEKIIQRLSEVFSIERSEIFIGASIGISVYPEDGKVAEELLKHADLSMYEAKKQGRNNYQFYKKDYTAASQDRLALEMKLRKALERHELQLYYQPQYHTPSKKLHGAEVLIRWGHGPVGQVKMIPPDHFIPIAEDTGLIVEIGQWILRTACLQMKQWLNQGYQLQRISVNISARQFSDNNFLKSVEDALREAELDAMHLELEITESMLIGDTKKIELQLQRLKKMGITIVLDDFGTGYSSLSYLKNFPIDVLKIDQSFIKGTALYSKNARIACAIINMGHSLGQKIVAEGVETEHQLMFLTHRGCDIIQGYYFSKPLSTGEMTTLLRAEVQGSGPVNKKSSELFMH